MKREKYQYPYLYFSGQKIFIKINQNIIIFFLPKILIIPAICPIVFSEICYTQFKSILHPVF